MSEEWKIIGASYIEDVANFATSTMDPIQAEIVSFRELQTLTIIFSQTIPQPVWAGRGEGQCANQESEQRVCLCRIQPLNTPLPAKYRSARTVTATVEASY